MNAQSLKSELQQVLDNDVVLRKEFNELKRSLSDYRNQLIMRDEDCKRLQVTIDVLNTNSPTFVAFSPNPFPLITVPSSNTNRPSMYTVSFLVCSIDNYTRKSIIMQCFLLFFYGLVL